MTIIINSIEEVQSIDIKSDFTEGGMQITLTDKDNQQHVEVFPNAESWLKYVDEVNAGNLRFGGVTIEFGEQFKEEGTQIFKGWLNAVDRGIKEKAMMRGIDEVIPKILKDAHKHSKELMQEMLGPELMAQVEAKIQEYHIKKQRKAENPSLLNLGNANTSNMVN